MTTRPDNATLQHLRLCRSKTLCTIFKVVRKDGFVLRWTDHDRRLTVDDELYEPLVLGGISAERREAALRSGNQEAQGIVDGVTIVVPDLLGNRYRGAKVLQRIVDWRMPWLQPYKATKYIRQLKWDGSRWIATLEAVSARLQRPVGGRFGGTASSTCQYVLGDPDTCKADIVADTIAGVTVATLIDNRMRVRFTVGTWPGTFADDYFRDGEIAWTTGANAGTVSRIVQYLHTNREVGLLLPTPFPIQVGDQGTARPGCDGLRTTCHGKFRTLIETGTSTGSNTSTTLNNTTQVWATNVHAGRLVLITSGSGAGQERTISSNTATQLVITPAWTTTPGSDAYRIRIPNILNFGGLPYDPGAGKVMEQPIYT